VIVDAHVHFWNPTELHYPWLAGRPALDRAFLPTDYRAATGTLSIAKILFVEANCAAAEALREVELVERLAREEPRFAAIVAFADLTDTHSLGATLDRLARSPMVRGIRHNIQGQPAGFCLQRAYVDGVREVGRRGLTFDLCATHDQLGEVARLVDRCPDTRFVLDHCGKPPIRDRLLEPWRSNVAALAAQTRVYCKLSGLLTEAAPDWSDAALGPYAECVVECFGIDRVMYGSDWPVLILAGSYCDWYGFTERFTAGWSPAERRLFYHDTAVRVYGL
jgi:L-fuconolactonase